MRHVGLRSNAKDIASQEQIDPWALQPIGVPFPLWTHLTGVAAPPADNPNYRYIKLTASDSYNTGVLISESVSGSGALLQATAVINDSGGPLDGETIRLINTESRVIQAGVSSGAVRADTFQGHTIGFGGGVDSLGAGSFSLAAGGFAIAGTGASFSIKHAIVSNGTDGTPRISDRTQSKSIDASYFMRIR